MHTDNDNNETDLEKEYRWCKWHSNGNTNGDKQQNRISEWTNGKGEKTMKRKTWTRASDVSRVFLGTPFSAGGLGAAVTPPMGPGKALLGPQGAKPPESSGIS